MVYFTYPCYMVYFTYPCYMVYFTYPCDMVYFTYPCYMVYEFELNAATVSRIQYSRQQFRSCSLVGV